MTAQFVSHEFRITETRSSDAYFASFSSWLAENGNRGRGHADKSVSAHVSDLQQFSAWFTQTTGQAFSAELVTPRDLRDWFTQSTQVERRAPATWNRRRISLGMFFSWALQARIIRHSPFQGVPVMEEPAKAPKGMNALEFHRFMRQVEQAVNTSKTLVGQMKAIRNRAMIALMVYAGLRESEVCNLRVEDLQISDRKGTAYIYNAKGKKTDSVPLGREVRIALLDWVKIHPAEGLIFDGITPRQVQRVVSDLGADCGLSITPHTLRHTFAYRFRESNQDLVKLQIIMRHSRSSTTAKYGMPRAEDLQAAVENL